MYYIDLQHSLFTEILVNTNYSSDNDERYQLDAIIVICYHQLSVHVSGIYMPIFRRPSCLLVHMVFSTVKENEALVRPSSLLQC
jgi:hypothetical protein